MIDMIWLPNDIFKNSKTVKIENCYAICKLYLTDDLRNFRM